MSDRIPKRAARAHGRQPSRTHTGMVEADVGGGSAALADDALERARAVLAASGLAGNVERAGHAGDMLVVEAPPGRIEDVRACAAELRTLGFRYVTIEIVPDA